MAVLIMWDLVFALVQPHRILDEEQSLIGQQRGTKCGTEIQRLEEHLVDRPASLLWLKELVERGNE